MANPHAIQTATGTHERIQLQRVDWPKGVKLSGNIVKFDLELGNMLVLLDVQYQTSEPLSFTWDPIREWYTLAGFETVWIVC